MSSQGYPHLPDHKLSIPPLSVVLAAPRGFCAGVERAIAIVERALERHGAPVYVRHEIVHNAHVVNRLRAMGAVFVEDLSEIPQGAVTVFSAHGVPASVESEAEARGLPVFDATCPLVTKMHRHGARLARDGREIILIGHAGHPEVIGTMGQIEARVHLVADAASVAALPLARETPVGYITQTTLSLDETRDTIAAIEARFADVEGPATDGICYATQNRQNAVRALAGHCDAVLVVGAANSSNSNRLRDLAAALGKPAWLVADAADIVPEWLDGVARLGLTAGASAPEAQVEAVLTRLSHMRNISVSELDGIRENVSFALPAALRDRADQRIAAQ